MLDGEWHCLGIPEEKRIKALNQVNQIKNQKKVTIKEIQCLTGLLNFLNRAMVPGCIFTSHMYSKLKLKDSRGRKLKQYHHINLDSELRKDLDIWNIFLQNAGASSLSRPFVDRDIFFTSQQLNFYTDASGVTGFGCYFGGKSQLGEWNQNFLEMAKPSIAL